MEFRNQDKSMGIANAFGYMNQSNQDSSAKRSSRGEDQKGRETGIHEDAVFDPSPDDRQIHNQQQNTHTKPRPDPIQIPTQPKPTGATAAIIRYRECQKNHAAHLGSHVVDGCCEFMPNGEEGTPEAMRCAACDCHRNFHRKEIEGSAGGGGSGPASNCYISFNASHSTIQRKNTNMANTSPSTLYYPLPFRQAPPIHHQKLPHPPSSTTMVFGDGMGGGGGVHGESSSEDLSHLFRSDGEGYGGRSSRKRFRTKFTQEQKDRMMELAQNIGWKIQKHDELEVQRFCETTGVKRKVFKVWMHNNKQAMKRQQS